MIVIRQLNSKQAIQIQYQYSGRAPQLPRRRHEFNSSGFTWVAFNVFGSYNISLAASGYLSQLTMITAYHKPNQTIRQSSQPRRVYSVFTKLHTNKAIHSIAVFGNLICKLTDTSMQMNCYRQSQLERRLFILIHWNPQLYLIDNNNIDNVYI